MTATPEEIAKVQEQLSQTCNDPNLAFLECHCFNTDVNCGHDDGIRDCDNCSAYQEFVKKYPNHMKKPGTSF